MGDLSDLSAVSIFLTMPVLHFLKRKLCQPTHVATFFTAGWFRMWCPHGPGNVAGPDVWEWVPKVFFVLSAIKDAFSCFFAQFFKQDRFPRAKQNTWWYMIGNTPPTVRQSLKYTRPTQLFPSNPGKQWQAERFGGRDWLRGM